MNPYKKLNKALADSKQQYLDRLISKDEYFDQVNNAFKDDQETKRIKLCILESK